MAKSFFVALWGGKKWELGIEPHEPGPHLFPEMDSGMSIIGQIFHLSYCFQQN